MAKKNGKCIASTDTATLVTIDPAILLGSEWPLVAKCIKKNPKRPLKCIETVLRRKFSTQGRICVQHTKHDGDFGVKIKD